MFEPLYSIQNAQKNFGTISLFNDLNLQIQEGNFISILGPSGSGKTTLLRLLAGLETWSSYQSLHKKFQNASFVFQEPNLLKWRTLKENILLPLELTNQSLNSILLQNLLEIVQLSSSTNQFPHELSGGMKMRTSLARALITQPQVLFMDEPFSSLDEPTRERLQEYVYQLWQLTNTTIVFVTHSISEAVFLSNQIIILDSKPTKIKKIYKSNLTKDRSSTLRQSNDYFDEIKLIRNWMEPVESESSDTGSI